MAKRTKNNADNESQKIPAIYIRVSTEAQAEEGYSIEAQKEQLSAYCVSRNLKNYEFYIDGGWSGSNINRPEIKRLINDVKNGKISHCIVYKLDRLSRSQKDTLYLIEDVFIPNDVSFISLHETLDTSTPMGKMMIGILSAFAQLERENIFLRTRMGMKERVKNGYWMGGGKVPFGYDYDKSRGLLVPNENAEKVRKIYSMYIDGKAPQVIADVLDLKYEKLVMQILTRKSNYGVIEYNGEIYQGKHEPIISKEIYDRAMECMKERSVQRTPTNRNLLTGLLICGHCGAKMRYQKWGKAGSKLVCYSQQKTKNYLIKDENCQQERLWASDVENLVTNFLFSLEEDSSIKDEEIVSIEQVDILASLQSNYLLSKKKIKRLYDLYATSGDELLLETINDEKENMLNIEEKIQIEMDRRASEKRQNTTEKMVENLGDTWEFLDDEEKQKIIRMLVESIVITDKSISVNLR